MGKAMLTMIRSRANAKGMIEAGLLVPNGDILRGKKGKESRVCNVSTTTSRCARLSHVSATVGSIAVRIWRISSSSVYCMTTTY